MEFTVKNGTPEKQRSPCLIIGVYEAHRLTPSAEKLDKTAGGYISQLLRRGDLEGKVGQTLLLHNVPETLAERVLLVGCGPAAEVGDTQYRKAVAKAACTIKGLPISEAVNYLGEVDVKDRDVSWKLRQIVEVSADVLYRYEQTKSKKDETPRPLRKFTLNVNERSELTAAEEALRLGRAVAGGVALAKELGNLPANICTPSYLADQARALGKRYKGVKVEVFDQADLEKLGMGALLAVARGSQEPPKFIVVHYRGGKKGDAPVALVGKGITFDTGGISIKPAAAMDEMKFDMCGAASVLGTLEAVAELGLPLNVVGLIPTTENMPSGLAIKPGDVVTSLSGQTIEILNTDAEGRLILCDALTYAERFEPAAVIDIATLTGACVIALGKHASGLMGNDAALVDSLLDAGKRSGDRAWQLPLWEEYQDQLKTNFADMTNVGGREGGTITAACFLSRYAKKYKWAHLDIAGTAWVTGEKKGATGRPVPLLIQYLLDLAAAVDAGTAR